MTELESEELRYFGTDGIRGTVGQHPITPEFCLRLGWAAGKTLAPEAGSLAIIGKDTRISGYLFESVLEAGLVSAGVNVGLLGPIPTPAVAYLARSLGASMGLVISASHNPYTDNGFKIFDGAGNKVSAVQEREIEAMLGQAMTVVDASRIGKAHRVEEAQDRYVAFCKQTAGNDAELTGLRVVLDCAHGAGYRVAPRVLRELGVDVAVRAAEPDGLNINDRCGSTDTRDLAREVAARGADIGIALDGDADRVIMVDQAGLRYDGDDLLYAIASSRQSSGRLSGGVVGTTMSNLGLEIALRDLDIPFARSDVGDRNVCSLLAQKGWDLGGETSGHLLCRDLAATGDGLVSALQVLSAMVETGESLAEMTEPLSKYPQALVNIHASSPRSVSDSDEVRAASRNLEELLGESGRVLVRPSGTEPVVRVMVEARDSQTAQIQARKLARVVCGVAAALSG